jgi:hypothetical protein
MPVETTAIEFPTIPNLSGNKNITIRAKIAKFCPVFCNNSKRGLPLPIKYNIAPIPISHNLVGIE